MINLHCKSDYWKGFVKSDTPSSDQKAIQSDLFVLFKSLGSVWLFFLKELIILFSKDDQKSN